MERRIYQLKSYLRDSRGAWAINRVIADATDSQFEELTEDMNAIPGLDYYTVHDGKIVAVSCQVFSALGRMTIVEWSRAA